MLNIATPPPLETPRTPTARECRAPETWTPAGEAGRTVLEPRESEPSAAIFNTATLLFAANPANSNLPSGETASEMSAQEPPTDNGDPRAVRRPLFGSMEKALMLPLTAFDAYR